MLSEEAKKIFLAGLGAAAVTAEKSKKIIDELIKKGELTVDQGKVINEELKHKVSSKIKEHVTVNVTSPVDVESVKTAIDNMTPEELQQVKAKIAEKEAKPSPEQAAGEAQKGNAGK